MVPISARAGEGTSWRGCWEKVGADGREEMLSLVWVRAGAELLQGFVGTRNVLRAVLACATAANICTEHRAEAGVVLSSRDAILGEVFQPRRSVSLLLQKCSALQDFSFASGENILLLIQQVMKLFLEKIMIINTLLSHSYSVPI